MNFSFRSSPSFTPERFKGRALHLLSFFWSFFFFNVRHRMQGLFIAVIMELIVLSFNQRKSLFEDRVDVFH